MFLSFDSFFLFMIFFIVFVIFRYYITRPRGQQCVLGIKRDIDKEREALILTDRPIDGHILS